MWILDMNIKIYFKNDANLLFEHFYEFQEIHVKKKTLEKLVNFKNVESKTNPLRQFFQS